MKQWELRGFTGAVGAPRPPSADPVDPRSVRALVDQLPALFWTTDPALRFTSCLGAELDELGLGPNQVVGASMPELFESPDQRAAAVIAHREALRGHSVPFELDLGGHHFRASVAPLKDATGDAIGTIGVALETDGTQVTAFPGDGPGTSGPRPASSGRTSGSEAGGPVGSPRAHRE